MLLKNTWMRYLIIGISVIFVSLSVFSCRKYLDTVEWGYTVEWIYKNNSGFDLTIEAYNREDELFASRYVSNDGYTTFEIWHSQIVVPFSFRHTSVYNFIPTDYAERIRIKFQNGICLSYPEQMLEKIFSIQSYMRAMKKVLIRILRLGPQANRHRPIIHMNLHLHGPLH